MKPLFNWSSKDLSSEIMIIRIAKIRQEVFFKTLLVLNKTLIIHSNLQFAPQRDEGKKGRKQKQLRERQAQMLPLSGKQLRRELRRVQLKFSSSLVENQGVVLLATARHQKVP